MNNPTVASILKFGEGPYFFHLQRYYGLHNMPFLLGFFRCKIYITYKLGFVPVHFMFSSFIQFTTVRRGCHYRYHSLPLVINFITVCGH